MGANYRLVGLIGGAYGFTQMAIRFPLGIFSDKIGKRKIFIILGMLFAATAAFVTFFFPSPYTLLLTRALGGVAASAWVTFTILGASYYPEDKSAKCMGHLSACNSVGRMAALLAGGLLAQRIGLEFSFLLAGIAGIIGIFISFFVKEKKKKIEKISFTELLAVAKNKQLLACSVLGIFMMFISFATTFGFIPLAASSLNASQFQLGLLGVVSTVPGIIMAPVAGTYMPRKFGICATLVIGFFLAGAGSALVAFTNSLAILFAVQVIGSIGVAILGTLLLGLCIHDISAERRATAMGFFQAVYGIGMFAGPATMGFVSEEFGINTAFIFTGAIGIFGALFTIIYIKKGHLTY
jgi:MFS family permease